MAYLFKNAQIWDGENDERYPGEVLVERNRISAVARGQNHIEPDGAQMIDGGGMTGGRTCRTSLTFDESSPSALDIAKSESFGLADAITHAFQLIDGFAMTKVTTSVAKTFSPVGEATRKSPQT